MALAATLALCAISRIWARDGETLRVETPAQQIVVESNGERTVVNIPAKTIEVATPRADDEPGIEGSAHAPKGTEDGPDGYPAEPMACYDNADDCAARAAQTCGPSGVGGNHGGVKGKAKIAAGSCTFTCADGTRGTCSQSAVPVAQLMGPVDERGGLFVMTFCDDNYLPLCPSPCCPL